VKNYLRVCLNQQGQCLLKEQNGVVYMQDPDEGPGYLAMADTKPSLLLEGEPPLLLDEWQMAPVIWDL